MNEKPLIETLLHDMNISKLVDINWQQRLAHRPGVGRRCPSPFCLLITTICKTENSYIGFQDSKIQSIYAEEVTSCYQEEPGVDLNKEALAVSNCKYRWERGKIQMAFTRG